LETGLAGDWVIEGEIFIFRTSPPKAIGDFSGINRPDGTVCDGFDADALADLLYITADELINLNRQGLVHITSRRVTPSPGADGTIEYEIRTPTAGVRQSISSADIRGNA
jgi:hypothetical protein